ncbi:MAG: hypothetical protein H6712_28650 [Myxococcales bacterium]|nr:hypothetical protein [Myxococcales bacterium]MCB9717853.1 hypothetical protein [Myxococcales bacterium]
MSRPSLLLAALLVVPACDSGTKDDDAAKTAKNDAAKPAPAEVSDEASKAEPAEPAAIDPWQAKLDARVLADSGLGKDGKLTAFDIVNCESGEKYCQVCRFGSSPKLMAVGTSDDEAFLEDLKDLDAIAQKYGEDKLKAFAVITDIQDGKGVTPKDVEAARTKANEMREKLAIQMPVVVPAPDADGTNRAWDEYYNITKSRTVMFADGRNEVHYSAVGPEDFADLDQAIKSVVES